MTVYSNNSEPDPQSPYGYSDDPVSDSPRPVETHSPVMQMPDVYARWRRDVPDAPSPPPVEHHMPSIQMSELADSPYARERRQLLKLLGDLHGTGVQNQLDLPQIAVIGSQSVGKSSLIESISGITLPRDSGTCTRCPMECRLEYSESSWRCRVRLRIRSSDSAETTECPFGPDITSPDEVTRRLRQAQRAVLRPGVDLGLFLNDADTRMPGAARSFTKDCVCIHVSGPNVTDLHFYDLPGIIVNVQDGQDASDIQLVESMVEEYIRKPGCIALLVVSCETDFENQGAGRLARKIDPSGETTVGVLTKPDRAEPETVEKWQKINSTHPLRSGWFVLKLPNHREMQSRISWEDAARNSHTFFATNASWHAYASRNPDRVGTANLAEYLSQQLSEQLNSVLPALRTHIQSCIQEVASELRSLPPEVVKDPYSEVLSLITNLALHVSKSVDGTARGKGPGMVQRLLQAYDVLRGKIKRTAPSFDPKRPPPPPLHIDDRPAVSEFHIEVPPETPYGATPYMGSSRSIHSWRESRPLFTPTRESSIPPVPVRLPSPDLHEDSDGTDSDGEENSKISIDYVMKELRQARTRELPGNVPFSVKERHIRDFLDKWEAPTMQCFDDCFEILSEELGGLVRQQFNKYGYGGLQNEALAVLGSLLDAVKDTARQKLQAQLQVETRHIYTQNEHYFFDYKAKFLARYKDARQGTQTALLDTQLQSSAARQSLNTALAALAALGFSGLSAKDLVRLHPPDKMDPALEIMAEVRAYFQVAFKRFADVIPSTIEEELVQVVQRDLTQAFITGLGLRTPESHERCKTWVQEPRAVTRKRNELQGKKRTLEGAQSILLNRR